MRQAVYASAALLLLLQAAAVTPAGFGAGVASTRCNTDPNKGEVNNPCGSLYDAVCGGDHCRCPEGMGVHPTLRRCVRGYDDGQGDNGNDRSSGQGSQGGLLHDLPFDYVPHGGRPTDHPLGLNVSDIPCGTMNDQCGSMYNAVCLNGRCQCSKGTKQSPTLTRCDPDPSYDDRNRTQSGFHSDRDHYNGDPRDHHDNDHDDRHDGNAWSSGSRTAGDVLAAAAVLIGLVAARAM